jgi:hypothetical protein
MTACSISPPGDGKDDSFTSGDGAGKSDDPISEGSREGVAVLRVANELTLDQLHRAAGLEQDAAYAIELYRRGPSEWGSGDERTIGTLAELDAIDWIGPEAFAKLLAFAEQRGYLDTPAAFAPTHCQVMPYTRMVAIRDQHLATSGTFSTRQRDTCDATSCSDWHDGSSPLAQWWTVGSTPPGTQHAVPATGTATLETRGFTDWVDLVITSGDLVVRCTDLANHEGWNGPVAGPTTMRCTASVNAGTYESPLGYDDSGQPSAAGPDTILVFNGTLCDDGRFHLISKLGFELDELGTLNNVTNNWNQIAIEGTF